MDRLPNILIHIIQTSIKLKLWWFDRGHRLVPPGPWTAEQLANLTPEQLAALGKMGLSSGITKQATRLAQLKNMLVDPFPLSPLQLVALQAMGFIPNMLILDPAQLAIMQDIHVGTLQELDLLDGGDVAPDIADDDDDGTNEVAQGSASSRRMALRTRAMLPTKPLDVDEFDAIVAMGLSPTGPWDMAQLAVLSADKLDTLVSMQLSPLVTSQIAVLKALQPLIKVPSGPLAADQVSLLFSFGMTEDALTNPALLSGLDTEQLTQLQRVGLLGSGPLISGVNACDCLVLDVECLSCVADFFECRHP
jgi:hypothetical protein